MSENTPKTTPVVPITTPPVEEAVVEVVVEKLSFFAKIKQFVKAHKRPAYAVTALLGLVGLAAISGRKNPPLPDLNPPLELESGVVDAEIVVEENPETTVA